MISLLVGACILLACFLLGAQLLAWVRRVTAEASALPLPERALLSLGLGLLAGGLVILALGLVGAFRAWVLWLGFVVGGSAVGVRQVPFAVEVLTTGVRTAWRGVRRSPRRLVYGLLLVWSLVTLPGALAPPNDLDYDGLSQHLAAPKAWLREGAIRPLWHDHHSQFPFTMQMLYAVALAAGRPAGAKVIHWACGVLAALALIVAGRRHLSPAAGAWSAFALLSTPGLGWLAGLAYVDLGSVFFAALLLLGFLRWLTTHETADAAACGLMAAGGMAVKMQGLQPAFVVGALLIVAALKARPPRAARQIAVYALAALAPASPWYVKSLLWTGNPVYPFGYGAFGGKYWSAALAAPYREHQLACGMGDPPPPQQRARMGLASRTFSGPRAPIHLLMAPWNLTMHPGEFAEGGLNPALAVATGVGPLLLATLPLLVFTGAPRPARWALAAFALLWLAWLMLMQYYRYLLPSLVFAVLPAGHVLGDGLPPGLGRWGTRGVACACALWSLVLVAVLGLATGSWRAGLGLVRAEEYLRTTSAVYRVSDWTNRLTPPKATVALYSEPRGYYLDRDYLWADAGHSRLIEYERVKTGDDLLAAYSRPGITHLLYCRLPGALDVFEDPLIGGPLKELVARDEARVIGNPPEDPSYTLLAIEAPWAKERLE